MVLDETSPQALSPTSTKNVSIITKTETRIAKGRPIRFDSVAVTKDFKNANGEYIIPTLYESQCPFCGVRIQFASNLKAVKCVHCKRGDDTLEYEEFIDPFCNPGDFDLPYRAVDQVAQPRIE